MSIRYVVVPGIGNSPPSHWQSVWEQRLERVVRVEQAHWTIAVRDAWVSAFQRTLLASDGPKLVIGHSLGALLPAEASPALASLGVIGAFLVSVPDVEGPAFPRSALKFRPAPSSSLSVPSVLIASTNDPYSSLAHSERVARQWGSELVCVGAKGHINTEPEVGAWAEGFELLERFTQRLLSEPRRQVPGA
jgi:uncharacterized protein